MARATEKVGLVTTVSSTFYTPFHAARMLASLDHISGGRIGWNVVTSMFDAEGIGHTGTERLLEFWEKAVATPDHIEFRFDRGIAVGDELLCIGTMRTHMGENIMEIDIAVDYRVDPDGRLVSLRAFWEQDVAMASGLRALTENDKAAITGAITKGK